MYSDVHATPGPRYDTLRGCSARHAELLPMSQCVVVICYCTKRAVRVCSVPWLALGEGCRAPGETGVSDPGCLGGRLPFLS